MEMEKATENDPLSNHSTALSRSWKFDKFNLPNDDDDESLEEWEGTSNHSNAALTHQSKKKNRGGN
jgi:hypothetical protein